MTIEETQGWGALETAKGLWDASPRDMSDPACVALAQDMFEKTEVCYGQAGIPAPRELTALLAKGRF